MLVHISNTGTGERYLGTRNKGGQLMVIAAAEHYAGTDVTLAVDDSFGTPSERKRVGVSRVCFAEYGWAEAVGVSIKNHLNQFNDGYAASRRDLHLNAAGFAYGDGWGMKRIEKLRSWNLKCERTNCPSVLMPQAFGPFQKADHAKHFVEAVKTVAQIYARDRVSYQHLQEIMPNDTRISLAPDFTIAVSGKAPDNWVANDPGDRLLIVPNSRMTDKLGTEAGKRYLAMLTEVTREAPKMGLRPIFVIHSGEDAKVAATVIETGGILAKVITSNCPLQLKGLLANGRVALASRFHSVVSALSGCTPTLVSGWSHKYAELLEDFGVPEFLIDDEVTPEYVLSRIREEADSSRQNTIKARLKTNHHELISKVNQMWTNIDSLLPHAPKHQSNKLAAMASA